MSSAGRRTQVMSPVQRALMAVGLGVPIAVIVGVIYGLGIGDMARGLGVGGAVTMVVIAILGVLVAAGLVMAPKADRT